MEGEYERWRNLIGDFMLEFAKVEGRLNGLLSDLTAGAEFELILQQQFKGRLCEVRRLLSAKVSESSLVARAVRTLDQLLDFAEKDRNLIAHSPLELSLESLFEDASYLEIRSHRDSDITYERLEKRFHELQRCLNEFESVCYRISCLLHPSP